MSIGTQTTLTHRQVRAAALKIARPKLKDWVVDALIEDDTDLDDRPCLRVTIVLKPGKSLLSRGQQTGEIRLALLDFMREQGDERRPFVHYATRAELEELANEE
ncbi:MAG: hypothetical protein ACLQUZ_05640 [Rhizomicrobium sp.]